MRRILKVCNDEAKILEAINAYLPMTSHNSWGIGSDGERVGVYWKISGMKVRQALMEKIWANSGIKMAVHYAESRGYRRDKIYNWRMIKSRFGETKVTYYCGGTPRWSDKPEALDYATRCHEGDVKAISEAIHSGTEDPLSAARAVKKQQQAEGRW